MYGKDKTHFLSCQYQFGNLRPGVARNERSEETAERGEVGLFLGHGGIHRLLLPRSAFYRVLRYRRSLFL